MDGRVGEISAHQAADTAVEGGGKEQPLAASGCGVHDAGHRGQKAEVGHVVSLVNHRHLDGAERAGRAFEQVDQAPWGGDDNIDALGKLIDLTADRRTAVNGRDTQARGPSERCEYVGDLNRELAGGHEHEPARRLCPTWPRWRGEAREHGKAERERLARAGLCPAEDVTPGQRIRHGCGLDREWHGHPLAGQRVHKRRGDAKVPERRCGRDRCVERRSQCSLQVGLVALTRRQRAA